jgi:hypothetical protein
MNDFGKAKRRKHNRIYKENVAGTDICIILPAQRRAGMDIQL